MNISKAAKATGISAKMIRYYEEIALLPKAVRSAAGYREYFPADIERLKFIYQARQLGFSLDEIKILIQLWQNEHRHSADVKALAQQHVQQLRGKISQMQHMVDYLQDLIASCAGDENAHCSILEKIRHPDHHV
ncbi:Cu(I)-responsive transcriptional regulator [Acinetobacter puyangensis]|uniref:MerR family transcriptional regulator, gold-responsive activator of gol and ges genes n=1 Tax=Acinetobacter puyangensis TaxID=1096779 RepID=A0A240E9X2_9GAMM|nr:Cu(I)-responsive transcriptional regulator [Acinetobacter puyangensis]SNX45504.1 MerR family transcriptional regulator, gold-responsive activator of gol and ges genes [Acinetobacter puyangensis]